MTVNIFFQHNYSKLKTFCLKYNLPEDYVNESYIKMNKISNLTGLTETELLLYSKRAMWNLMISHKRLNKTKRTVNFIDDNIKQQTIEKALIQEHEDHHESQIYKEELAFLSRKLFDYIEKKCYTEIEIFILKAYVFSDLTYKELEKKIGISHHVAKNTMRKFRNDLRENFTNYLKQ